MRRQDFQFHLPGQLIAQYPPENRGDSRLLCLQRQSGAVSDARFDELQTFLRAGDLLIFNDTEVVPARLFARKESGGKVEILLERILSDSQMLCQLRVSKKPKPGSILILEDGTELRMTGRQENFFELSLSSESVTAILKKLGHMPLPPYIQRSDDVGDKTRYQTVYAREPGAVGAPTAGLHFTSEHINELSENGVDHTFVTLHVGAGTFQPVRSDEIEAHTMHSEWFELKDDVCEKIVKTKRDKGRVIAVGTTSVRCLESASRNGQLSPYCGETDIFIYPGYEFQTVDALITNFHLPESTLLMLVSAFAGREKILSAYEHAVDESYRFFSYGDAMFIY